jgi:TPR repeat protein
VEKNNVEAVKWFRQAAAKGSAEAQNNLGVMYTQGPEVALEYVKTARK